LSDVSTARYVADVNPVLRGLWLILIVGAVLTILDGLASAATQDWNEAAGGVASGMIMLFVIWWLPRRAVKRQI